MSTYFSIIYIGSIEWGKWHGDQEQAGVQLSWVVYKARVYFCTWLKGAGGGGNSLFAFSKQLS